MIWLSSSTIARLRDQLRMRAERPSVVSPDAVATADAIDTLAASLEYGPLCEAMYLMMSADGSVGEEERAVLKGALKSLSDDALSSSAIDAMVDAAASSVERAGRDRRLAEVAAQLCEDPARSEVAFVLAAAVAFADSAIADEENETLGELAEALGIDEKRVEELLDNVEADLARRPG